MSRFTFLSLLLSFVPSSVFAGTWTTFMPVQTGLYDNASDGFVTYAMRVTADTDWTNSDIDVNLTEGNLIHVPPAF